MDKRERSICVRFGDRTIEVALSAAEAYAIQDATLLTRSRGASTLVKALAAPRGFSQLEADANASGKPVSEYIRDVTLSAIGAGALGSRCLEAGQVYYDLRYRDAE